MLKLSIQIAFAAAVVGGSTTIAAAQGFDPNGANRFQQLAQAGTAGYYLGEMQGPMAAVIMREMASAQANLNAGYQPPTATMYARRRVYAPRSGMVSRQVSAPVPGYVTPQY